MISVSDDKICCNKGKLQNGCKHSGTPAFITELLTVRLQIEVQWRNPLLLPMGVIEWWKTVAYHSIAYMFVCMWVTTRGTSMTEYPIAYQLLFSWLSCELAWEWQWEALQWRNISWPTSCCSHSSPVSLHERDNERDFNGGISIAYQLLFS